MRLCFFGYVCSWMDALNNKLILNGVTTIKNVTSIHSILNHDYDIVIPLLEEHALTLHENKINNISPTSNIINTFRCKSKFYDYVITNSLHNYVANTYRKIDEVTFLPIIVKPFSRNSGEGMFVIPNTVETMCMDNNELEKHIEKMCLLNGVTELTGKYVLQDYIASPIEYVAHIYAVSGKIKKCIVYEQRNEKENYIKTAVSNADIRNIRKVTLSDKHVMGLEEVLKPCLYSGICNVNFKIVDDCLKIFEINPRLGGSLMIDGNRDDLIDLLNAVIEHHMDAT